MKNKDIVNLAQVKLALADKYARLARSVSSKPRKAVYHRQSERFRRQAEDARRATAG